MLEITDLTCTRGDRQLFSGLNFSLDSGALLYVKGQNGCGKTTLLRAICGLFLPESGEIYWNGEEIRRLSDDYRREILYFGHHNGIKGDLTSVENLRINSRLSGYDVSDKEIWAALEHMGLYGFEDLPTRVLSQGQKRRAALARLLLTRSKLWILDEPFSALDMGAVEHLQEVIANHIALGGMAILTTHQEVALTTGQVEHLQLDA